MTPVEGMAKGGGGKHDVLDRWTQDQLNELEMMVKEYTVTTTAREHIKWSKLVPALIAKGVRPRTTTVKSARGAWERRSIAGKSWSDATKRTPHFKCKFCGEWKLGHICKAAVNDTKDSKANRMSTLRAIRDQLQKECDELESEVAAEAAKAESNIASDGIEDVD